MKKITFLLVIVIVVCWQQLNAQTQDTTKQHPRIIKHPVIAFKWSPVHLAYFYPSIQIAIEHRVFRKLNVQYDLGVVVNSPYGNSERFSNKRGFRLIGELRYFLPSPPKVPLYVAGEFYHSKITFDRAQVAGYGCQGGDCDYYQYLEYEVKHTNSGAGVKTGVLLFPGWNKNRSFFFDINVGLAYRNITYQGKPYVDQSLGMVLYDDDEGDNIFTPSEQNSLKERLVIGVRLCYKVL